MDLGLLRARWSATIPPDYVRPADRPEALARCCHKRCKNPVAIKKNGEPAKACQRCQDRRARSCKRRRSHFVAQGGCRRCAYRERMEGDFLCERCREDRDRERDQKRQDAIDEFAAEPDKVLRASNLDIGVSPWNARSKPGPLRNGGTPSVTTAGAVAAVDPAIAAGARDVATARPGHPYPM